MKLSGVSAKKYKNKTAGLIVTSAEGNCWSRSRRLPRRLRRVKPVDTARAGGYIKGVLRDLPMTIYTDNGYANREEYLDELREEYGPLVDVLIGVLPASEDFDGLVTELEDARDAGYLELLEVEG